MKKLIYAIFLLTVCISLAGCTGITANTTPADPLRKTSSIISNNNRNMFTAEDEDFIYFFDIPTVKKLSKTDNSVSEIFSFDGPDYAPEIFSPTVPFEYFNDRIYLITSDCRIISMDTNGEQLLSADIPMETLNDDRSYIFTPYTCEDKLYLISSYSGLTYHVNPETLALEPADSELRTQYVTKDGTIFTKTTENDFGKLYVTPKDGNMTLFSSETESVILNRVNFTDSYVFFVSLSADFSAMNLYRVDMDGKNKQLIKSASPGDAWIDVQYDNEYVYFLISNEEYWKIHKETLEETNIMSVPDITNSFLEMSNEKFFFTLGPCYYIDTVTGEKVDL